MVKKFMYFFSSYLNASQIIAQLAAGRAEICRYRNPAKAAVRGSQFGLLAARRHAAWAAELVYGPAGRLGDVDGQRLSMESKQALSDCFIARLAGKPLRAFFDAL
jgi:hypothetical protein